MSLCKHEIGWRGYSGERNPQIVEWIPRCSIPARISSGNQVFIQIGTNVISYLSSIYYAQSADCLEILVRGLARHKLLIPPDQESLAHSMTNTVPTHRRSRMSVKLSFCHWDRMTRTGMRLAWRVIFLGRSLVVSWREIHRAEWGRQLQEGDMVKRSRFSYELVQLPRAPPSSGSIGVSLPRL